MPQARARSAMRLKLPDAVRLTPKWPLRPPHNGRVAIAENLAVAHFLKGGPKKLFIGGRWVESATGKTFATLDPATGEGLAHVAEGGKEDIDRAVKSARASFESGSWRGLPPAERAR